MQKIESVVIYSFYLLGNWTLLVRQMLPSSPFPKGVNTQVLGDKSSSSSMLPEMLSQSSVSGV